MSKLSTRGTVDGQAAMNGEHIARRMVYVYLTEGSIPRAEMHAPPDFLSSKATLRAYWQ
jgi:hypothetical protein